MRDRLARLTCWRSNRFTPFLCRIGWHFWSHLAKQGDTELEICRCGARRVTAHSDPLSANNIEWAKAALEKGDQVPIDREERPEFHRKES